MSDLNQTLDRALTAQRLSKVLSLAPKSVRKLATIDERFPPSFRVRNSQVWLESAVREYVGKVAAERAKPREWLCSPETLFRIRWLKLSLDQINSLEEAVEKWKAEGVLLVDKKLLGSALLVPACRVLYWARANLFPEAITVLRRKLWCVDDVAFWAGVVKKAKHYS